MLASTVLALVSFGSLARAGRLSAVGLGADVFQSETPSRLTSRGDGLTSLQSSFNTSLVPPRRPPGRPDQCPPCFNCLLPAFNCGNGGECNPYDGQCRCPPGFGGQDCLTPLCGALTDGDERYPRPEGKLCECKDGWGGINCNVCKTDEACKPFKTRTPVDDGRGGQSLDGEGDEDSDMVCYKGGIAVEHNYQMCDVTNRKIIDTIPDNRPPQVTFDCSADGPSSDISSWSDPSHPLLRTFADSPISDKATGKCTFQFWVDRIESFYCKLDQCSWRFDGEKNGTTYECKTLDCSCIPGRFLCGEDGSVNIDDFLEEEVHGPGTFSCVPGKGCTFSEPAMDGLINDIFGDPAIFLNCDSGECLHQSQVPGQVAVEPRDNSLLIALSASAAAAVFIAACFLLWYFGRSRNDAPGYNGVELPEDEAAKLMTDHIPATLHFNNVCYSLTSGKPILSHITGTVRPGELLAIMGASGAGKSTLLDILARKDKSGMVDGQFYVNGREIPDEAFRRVTGFVDQEDTLLPTLTVYEAVLLSALLRLPREMSRQAKVFRTLETMNELGILGIKDSRIGESGKRSISGGEKRRVSIACELVTGPSILFLDEPTSGLDSYNALNVISSLATLAKNFNRTVVFTIHQPQSNIVKLFDRLLVLAKGQLVYNGETRRAYPHFEKQGYKCPEGYNIADYLIDLTVDASGDGNVKRDNTVTFESHRSTGVTAERDLENGRSRRRSHDSDSDIAALAEDGDRAGEIPSSWSTIKYKATRMLGLSTVSQSKRSRLRSHASTGTSTPDSPDNGYAIPQKLASLVLANRATDDTKILEAEIARIQSGTTPDGIDPIRSDGLGQDVGKTDNMRGFKKATWGRQFLLLSGRAFKNLYRNPLLMATNYAVAIGVALICGFFFYKVTNDIPGFQNRLGLFLFILSLFGFSCLSSLGIFANERILFMRERANGYYSASAYFASKVLFDILPLRVIPPFVLGSIVYGLAGLNPDVACFWKFIMTLVLFNLAASSVVLLLSVAVQDLGVASLLGSLVMLYNLLFAGLLMNYDRVPNGAKWMLTTSFFHAAYEALLVNELRYLQLIEHKFGLDIQVPSATILSSFGFHAQAFWWPDTALLVIVFAVCVILSYLVLEFFVKERR